MDNGKSLMVQIAEDVSYMRGKMEGFKEDLDENSKDHKLYEARLTVLESKQKIQDSKIKDWMFFGGIFLAIFKEKLMNLIGM